MFVQRLQGCTNQPLQIPGYIGHRRCTGLPAATALTTAAAPARAAEGTGPLAEVQRMVADRTHDEDPVQIAQELDLTMSYLSSQPGALPPDLQHAVQLAQRALLLTDLMATGSIFRTLQMLKRHPALLQLPGDQVATRVLQLKLLLPAADVSRLLYQKPTLLLIDDLPGVVGAALNKLHALMPGIPVEAKLHEGGTVFWSFSSLLQDTASKRSSSVSSSAGSAGDGSSSAQTSGQQQQQHRISPCPSSPDAHLSRQQC